MYANNGLSSALFYISFDCTAYASLNIISLGRGQKQSDANPLVFQIADALNRKEQTNRFIHEND